MNNQLKGLIYFYMVDIRHSLKVFWIILLSILMVSIAFGYYIKAIDGGMMTFSLTGPIYIYCSIVAFISVREYIPFAIKMGATRKNIFISIGIFFLLLSAVKAIVASLLQELVLFLITGIGIDGFYFLHLAHFIDDTWYIRIGMDIMTIFFAMSFMFMLGLIFYRYGFFGGGITLGIVGVIFLFGIATGWIVDFIAEIISHLDMLFFIQLFAVGIFFYFLSFFILKRMTIVKMR
ncbi:hypothetical protein [Virgibacillus salexigens]|uniref:Uncharacterized protein n=1 Tax=Virgibacillus massiliensis TaxID=1462526 RepID=A0A024QHV4_9BACI|nr:hypothetical protein [Virgibacillus massiliensis]CDQ42079.1 hypothetical protein BN990_04459 [Virgibacillus massiliensis]